MFKIKLNIEPRLLPSAGAILSVSFFALAIALLAASLIFLTYDIKPVEAYRLFFKGAFGSWYAISETIKRTIPLLLTGIGLAFSFKASVWNIGAEGQILLGAIFGSWIALFSGIPAPFLLIAMFAFGFLGGAVWALVAAVLRSKLAVNEIITSLMLNYVAANIVLYLIHGPWKGQGARGFAYTDTFPESAWLGTIGSTRIPYATLIIGIIIALICYLLISRTTLGYEIRVVGNSIRTARLVGINDFKIALLAMFVSGGLAGLAGVGEVSGIHHLLRHPSHISLGYGYTAIIVAWLARNNPLAVILTAFFFGALVSGGDALRVSLGIPFQLVYVLNGLILFSLIASERLTSYKLSFQRKNEKERR